MIGLGSNRLTCCRRGGMSVTQAGRGGMEWLAGGRVPSWASPYSDQATAALKAQFPTQWPTIRDYGFAHPALVPFVNDDPMIVMSLISGLGDRGFLTSDGHSTIDTAHTPTKDVKTHTKFILPSNNAAIYGSAISYSSRTFELYGYSGGEINYGNAYQIVGGLVGNVVELWSDANVFKYKVNGGSLVTKTFGAFSGTFPYDLALFANRRGAMPTTGYNGVKIAFYEMEDVNDFKQNLVPIVGTTMNGMVDVADLEHPVYHENKGTGAFSITSPS